MPQDRRAQATHDRRTLLSATVCRAGGALRRPGELARAPAARKRRQDHLHVKAVISRIPPSCSILKRRPGRRSHTPTKPPVRVHSVPAVFGWFLSFFLPRIKLVPWYLLCPAHSLLDRSEMFSLLAAAWQEFNSSSEVRNAALAADHPLGLGD